MVLHVTLKHVNANFKRSEIQPHVMVSAQSLHVISFHCGQCWKSCLTQVENGNNIDQGMSNYAYFYI